MKHSYYQCPRTMRDGTWAEWACAIEHHPQSRVEIAAGVVLAVVLGIVLAAALVHWWAT